MQRAARKIIDGLKKAKVSAADLERTEAFIEEASDYDAELSKRVKAAADYVCGVTAQLPALDADLREDHLNSLLGSLSTGLTLDAWDRRALDLIAQCRDTRWFWQLERWLRLRVEAHPAEPVFEQARELLQARGLWKTDAEVVDSLSLHLRAHVTRTGELTSTGRWLLARLDEDGPGLLASIRSLNQEGERDRVSYLYPLLAHHRRALFDQVLASARPTGNYEKTELIEVLLQVDAAAYEAYAVKLMDGLTVGRPAFTCAQLLHRCFPGKHLPLLKALLITTVKADDDIVRVAGEQASSRLAACTLAWQALGQEAAGVWSSYSDENDAYRLRFYETIATLGGAFALPWLLDGLVYRKDWRSVYGDVTHPKYVTRMLALLAPHDLRPHADRIEKAFADNASPKIQEVVAKALGRKAARKKEVPAFDGKHGYRFDAYVDGVVKAAFEQAMANRKKIPEPVSSIKLGGQPDWVQLNYLELEGEGRPFELAVAAPETEVPGHIDDGGGSVLAGFNQRHGLDPDGSETPSWGDMYKLPWCVLIHEQIAGARALAGMLEKAGVKLAKGCKIGVGEHDNFWTSGFDERARAEVAALPESQQADFAAVCFESAAKQKWLLGQD